MTICKAALLCLLTIAPSFALGQGVLLDAGQSGLGLSGSYGVSEDVSVYGGSFAISVNGEVDIGCSVGWTENSGGPSGANTTYMPFIELFPGRFPPY